MIYIELLEKLKELKGFFQDDVTRRINLRYNDTIGRFERHDYFSLYDIS